MSNTIEQFKVLSDKRQRWVDANKENNFEDGLKRLLTELYPDNAHFIYELLQNAEDAQAQEVRFILYDGRIEFEHDGNSFLYEDVDAITSIGFSTKRDDNTKIGKFGVGFKSVFAYTDTPAIQSGEFHFQIKDLVVPVPEVSNNAHVNTQNDKQTRFTLPFNNNKKTCDKARSEITKLLKSLDASTLLFLIHIRKIEYLLPDSSLGYIERIDHTDKRFEIRVQHPTETVVTSTWFMKFDKKVTVEEEAEEKQGKDCHIAIAFSLSHVEAKVDAKKQADNPEKTKPEWELSPIKPMGSVCIYFPAIKESSNLRFHLHAPFASTVARDSVRDCAGNNALRNHLAALLAESIHILRDQGLLTVKSLAILPNDKDNLPAFYKPLMDMLIQEFNTQGLVPMKQGGHAAAEGTYRGAKALSDLIDDENLALLLQKDSSAPLWVANPSQMNQREDNFLSMLSVNEWNEYSLCNTISSLPEGILVDWMQNKDDIWHQRLYALLENYAHKLRDSKIVRTNCGTYCKGNECFFEGESLEFDNNLFLISKEMYFSGKEENKDSRNFLESLGVRNFDEKTLVELSLENYRCPKKLVEFESIHYSHIKRYITYWKNNPSDTKFFGEYTFLVGISYEGSLYWRKPEKLCVDTPYLDTGLAETTVIHQKDVIWHGYAMVFEESQLADFTSFLKSIGVMSGLKVSPASIWKNQDKDRLLQGLSNYNRDTDSGINKDYLIEFLDKYIDFKSVSASKAIWHCLLSATSEVSKAEYRPNRQHSVKKVDSQLIYYLKNNAWIPDKSGEFRNPQDMTRDDLRIDFPYDDRNGLLTAIGFGEKSKQATSEYQERDKFAKESGLDSADELDRIAKRKKDDPEGYNFFLNPPAKPVFPVRPVSNPARRSERLDEQIAEAPVKEYEARKRNVRTTSGAIDPITWLKNQYTTDDLMVCQICKEEMPFRKHDGTHYFEKKEMLSIKYFQKEHEAQYLALCPLCAAKYKEFVIGDDNVMAGLKETIVNADYCEIPISLGDEKTSIRFVETHYFDLKEILTKPE